MWKRWLKRTAIALGLLLLALVVLGGLGFYWMSTPTTGPRIDAYSQPRKALLVIDIQEDYTGGRDPLFADHQQLIAAANRVLDASNRLGLLPVYVRQEVPDNALGRLVSGGRALRGHPGAQTDARIRRIAGAPDFSKERSDGFSNPALDAWLRAHQIDELYLVGLDAKYCVLKTTLGALSRGYKVTVIGDAITTGSGTPLPEIHERMRAAGARIVTLADLGL